MELEEKKFFIATKGRKNEDIIYSSPKWNFSEWELLALIKICLVDQRSREIGRKILLVYRDSTEHEKELAIEKLRKIGIKEEEEYEPDRPKKSKQK